MIQRGFYFKKKDPIKSYVEGRLFGKMRKKRKKKKKKKSAL
jgi:hypothetical protein